MSTEPTTTAAAAARPGCGCAAPQLVTTTLQPYDPLPDFAAVLQHGIDPVVAVEAYAARQL